MTEKEKKRRKYFTGYASEYYLRTGEPIIEQERRERASSARVNIEKIQAEIDKNSRKKLNKKIKDIPEENIVFV